MLRKKLIVSVGVICLATLLAWISADISRVQPFSKGDFMSGGFPFKYVSDCSSPAMVLIPFDDCTDIGFFLLNIGFYALIFVIFMFLAKYLSSKSPKNKSRN